MLRPVFQTAYLICSMYLPLKHNFKSKIYLIITCPPHLHHPTIALLVSANYSNGIIGQIKTFCIGQKPESHILAFLPQPCIQ